MFYDRLGTANLAKKHALVTRKSGQRIWRDAENMARLGNAEQVDVTVWRTTQALSVRDLLPHMQGMRKADIIRRLENELGETAGNV